MISTTRLLLTVLPLITFVVSSILGVYIFIRRDELEATSRPVPPSTLYSPRRIVTDITDLGAGKIRLQIAPALEPDETVTLAGQRITPTNSVLHLSLPEGRSTLTFHGRERDEMVWDHTPARTYSQRGNLDHPSGVTTLRESSIDFGPVPMSPDEFSYITTRAPVGSAAMGRLVEAFALWIEPRRGIPNSAAESSFSPEQINAMLDKRESAGWCSTFARLAPLHLKGLRVRIASTGGFLPGGVRVGGHTFNEVYDPKVGRWRLVDFTLRIAEIVDPRGMALNASELTRYYRATHPSLLALRYGIMEVRPSGDVGTRQLSFAELPEPLREDLLAYYGPHNRLYVHDNSSPMYDRSLSRQVRRWFLHTGKYRVVHAPNWISWYDVRLANNWISLGSACLVATAAVRLLCRRTRARTGRRSRSISADSIACTAPRT